MRWTERAGRRLKPRDLQIFMAVFEQRNMQKAAEGLAISRPAISKAIAELEHTLGVPLFDRTPQGVEPTTYAEALRKRSTAMFEELNLAVKEIEFLADPSTGELRVGCTETVTAGLVSAVIDRLSRQHPKLLIQLELSDVATLQSHFLRERKCEVVVSRMLTPVPEPDMDAEPLFHEQSLVVAKPPNRWLRRRKVTLADLADEPWILSPLEVIPGAPPFEAFRAIGLALPGTIVLSNSHSLRNSLLATGRFLTVVPGSVLRFGPVPALFNVLPVELPRPPLPVAITTLKNRTLSPMAQLFIDCVRDLARPLAQKRWRS